LLSNEKLEPKYYGIIKGNVKEYYSSIIINKVASVISLDQLEKHHFNKNVKIYEKKKLQKLKEDSVLDCYGSDAYIFDNYTASVMGEFRIWNFYKFSINVVCFDFNK